jgi:hypothetical protein
MKPGNSIEGTLAPKGKTAVLMVTVFLYVGCTGGNYGMVRLSSEINRLFESHQILQDHHYYFTGSDVRPNAILGIQRDYVLVSRLWKPVNMTSEQLKKWIDLMTDHRGFALRIYGCRILDSSGRQAAIWYSPWIATGVSFGPGNEIRVNTPTPSVMERKNRSFIYDDIW